MAFVAVGKENTSPIHLYYTDHGQGRPFVLIHGFPFSGRAWEKIEAQLLESGQRVICYDRRGFGLSSHSSSGYDYDTFASDLNTLLKELKLQDVTLVGHSMGSGEITRYLSQYGDDQITNAVFISPIPPYLLQTDDNPEGVEQDVFEGFKKQIREDRYAFITDFLKSFYSLGLMKSGISDEKLRADFASASMASPLATLKCVDTWLTDFRADLPRIQVPSLIIQGDNDKILPFEKTGERMASLVGARLRVIQGGSHGIPWTHAEEISDLILDFCEETTRVPRKTEASIQPGPLH